MEQLVKINKELDNEFETFVLEAESCSENAKMLLLKATAMKHKCNEKEDINWGCSESHGRKSTEVSIIDG